MGTLKWKKGIGPLDLSSLTDLIEDFEGNIQPESAVAEELAGKLNWRFGQDAELLNLPEGHKVIASCSL